MSIIEELFIEWKLDTWANVLEIIGFVIATSAFIIGLLIKSEINRLKTDYVFDKTIKKQIKKLIESKSMLNTYLNNYDNNRALINTEFGTCQIEIEDLISKLSHRQGGKGRRLIRFIKKRKVKPFAQQLKYRYAFLEYILKYPQRLYQTTYNDTWLIYNRLVEIIRQMENIVDNKKNTL